MRRNFISLSFYLLSIVQARSIEPVYGATAAVGHSISASGGQQRDNSPRARGDASRLGRTRLATGTRGALVFLTAVWRRWKHLRTHAKAHTDPRPLCSPWSNRRPGHRLTTVVPAYKTPRRFAPQLHKQVTTRSQAIDLLLIISISSSSSRRSWF
jgi:hypothetical protein